MRGPGARRYPLRNSGPTGFTALLIVVTGSVLFGLFIGLASGYSLWGGP